MLSAVILQHNLHERTAIALDSLRASRVAVEQIIIVDNGSTDRRALDWLADLRGVGALVLGENDGYSGGTNEGWRFCNGEYILLCNNDIALSDSCVGRMVDAMQADATLGWVSACYQAGGWEPCIVPFPDPIAAQLSDTRGACRETLNTWAATLAGQPRIAGVTESTVIMVRKAASDAIGYFDADLWYHHSHDYALRLADAGWRTAVLPNAVFWHDVNHPTLAHIGGAIDWNAKRKQSDAIMDKRWGARWRSLA